MRRVVLDISMSLDGFITGPNDNPKPFGYGDNNVYVLGGANIADQCLRARLLDSSVFVPIR